MAQTSPQLLSDAERFVLDHLTAGGLATRERIPDRVTVLHSDGTAPRTYTYRAIERLYSAELITEAVEQPGGSLARLYLTPWGALAAMVLRALESSLDRKANP